MTEKAHNSGNMEDSQILDFSRIEGDWEGEAIEQAGHRAWVKISLDASSEQGSRIGSISYGHWGSDEVVCEGILEAIRASSSVFIVSEKNPEENSCPDGAIRLELDSQQERMSYEFTPYNGIPIRFGTGTITRIRK